MFVETKLIILGGKMKTKKILALILCITLISEPTTMAFADVLENTVINKSNSENINDGNSTSLFSESSNELAPNSFEEIPNESLPIPSSDQTSDNIGEDIYEDSSEDISGDLSEDSTEQTPEVPESPSDGNWVLKDSGWYYLYTDGTMATGWITVANQKYFLNSDGIMATGWLWDSNNWYYLNKSGAMATGWVTVSNYKYYLNSDGTMATGWLWIDNDWYYFSPGGGITTGWITVDNNKYFLNSDGAMATGWLWNSNNWYYLDRSGAMTTGWLSIGNNWYYLADSGKMATGWLWNSSNWYYLNTSGAMTTGWLWNSNDWYYLNESGAMTTGWLLIGDTWYYLENNGKMATGWIKVADKWYYLNKSGAMASNTTIDGYSVDYSGACTNRVTEIPNGKRINVPYISQKGVLPTGCETVSATMLLRYYGYSTSIYDFVDKYLKKADFEYINGRPYAPTPDEAFIGNPRSSSGFGCFPPVIEAALKLILSSTHTPKVTTGTPIDALIKEYIDKDTPVLLWATINMLPSYNGYSWYTRPNNEKFTWTAQEHCLVLVGYDNNKYYFNDPYNNNGVIGYDKALVKKRFAELGMRSLVIE